MKKIFSFAVAATIVALCAVLFSSCDAAEEKYSVEGIKKSEVKTYDVRKDSCGVTANTYQAGGAIATRAAEVEHLDGTFTATSRMKAVFSLNGEVIARRTWTEINKIEGRGIYKPLYAKTLDSFKEKNVRMTDEVFKNGQTGKFVKFAEGDGHNFYYSFIVTHEAESDTFQIWNKTKRSFETFNRCHNELVELRFLSQRVTDLQRDSAGWHAYSLVHVYSGRLSEGPNNGFTYEVNIPLVWVWKGTSEPEYPEEKPEIIVWEDGEEGFDFVNDSTSQSWKDIIPTLATGTKGKPDRIAVLVPNTYEEPEYQILTTDNLSWGGFDMVVYDEVTEGPAYDKENNISVTPFVKTVKTRNSKGACIFKFRREGRIIFTDSLGGKHYLPERSWSVTDDGWTDKSMEPMENFERKLLTSHIIGTFNEHSHNAKGEIELRKTKEADVELVNYEYENPGIRPITPSVLYWSYYDQIAVFSNGNKEKVGEIGTKVNIKTDSPEKQEIEVDSWDIQDLTIRNFNATRGIIRRDTISTGVFTITPSIKKNVTRTNKSEHEFVTTYDGEVVFKDKFGNEVKFLALDPSFADKGGVATLSDLPEANDFERKAMTSTLAVTAYGEDVSNHKAEVIFKKKVEKEELLSWDKEQSLEPAGNGLWTSTSTLILNYKLGGQKKIGPMTITEDWSIVGEGKTHIVLDEAKAPYANFNDGNWGAPTESHPYDGVTMLTYSKTYSENYTTLTDKYTAKKTTATFRKVIDGKEISFDFLSPNEMRISHKADNLVDGKRTATEGSMTYDVYDHTGSVTAMVTGNGKSQTQSATDEKEIWVKQAEVIIVPEHPEWGYPVGLANNGATLVYHKLVGDSQEGAFHKNLIIKYEKGILVVTTHSYGMKGNNWNPVDFTYTEEDFYYYGKQYYGRTLTQSNSINSAILRNDKWEPAAITPDGSGWVYVGISGNTVNMSQNLAVTAGIKNFNGETTAANNPYLRWSGKVDNQKVLTIYNAKGVPVIRFK